MNIPGLGRRALWMGHISKEKHHSLIEDINQIPMEWRDILSQYRDFDADDKYWSHNCAADNRYCIHMKLIIYQKGTVFIFKYGKCRNTWKVLSLINQGSQIQVNLQRLPAVATMLESLNNLMAG